MAKCLVPVAGKPVLRWALDAFPTGTFSRRIVVTNHRFFADLSAALSGIAVLDDGSTRPDDRLGAIGDLAFAVRRARLAGDDLVVVAGDNLFTEPLGGWLARASRHPCVIGTYSDGTPELVRTLASVATAPDGQVLRLVEKPAEPESLTGGIALYYFSKKILPLVEVYLDEGNAPDNVGYLFEWLTAKGHVWAEPVPGTWFDIGSPDALAAAESLLAPASVELRAQEGEGASRSLH
jgi:glucose-1-phosphate thymidylyltransferase